MIHPMMNNPVSSMEVRSVNDAVEVLQTFFSEFAPDATIEYFQEITARVMGFDSWNNLQNSPEIHKKISEKEFSEATLYQCGMRVTDILLDMLPCLHSLTTGKTLLDPFDMSGVTPLRSCCQWWLRLCFRPHMQFPVLRLPRSHH